MWTLQCDLICAAEGHVFQCLQLSFCCYRYCLLFNISLLEDSPRMRSAVLVPVCGQVWSGIRLSHSGPAVRSSALPCVKQSLEEGTRALLFLFSFPCVFKIQAQNCRTQTFTFLFHQVPGSLLGVPHTFSGSQQVNGAGCRPQPRLPAWFRQLPRVPLAPRGEPEEVPTDRNVLLPLPVMKTQQSIKS